MKLLYVIPARGGSKGIPHKNIKPLNGKPLIYYTIDVARQLTSDENICISTDDDDIIEVVQNYGIKVAFKRPAHLATDTATTNNVLLHALKFYESNGIFYDAVILLQPTSPLRKATHIKDALELYNEDLDMVVSVKKSYAMQVLCSENEEGYIELHFNKRGLRRQELSNFYEYNGSIYIINVERLKEKGLNGLTKKKKYIMDEKFSIDIDTPIDWLLVDSILKNKCIK